jgi:hypothetical protein
LAVDLFGNRFLKAVIRRNHHAAHGSKRSVMASMEFFEEGAAREMSEALGQRDECVRAALALTALFDGEANAADAKLAREHLEACARCATLWQSWSRYRFLLRRLPVPAAPPALLTRILLAVRLMGVARPGVVAPLSLPHEAEPRGVEAHDARLLSEVVWLSGANPFAPRRGTRKSAARIESPRELPPLDPLAPQPPAGLRDEILRRTIGAQAVEIVETPPVGALKARRAWNFSTVLMPALAAWLIFLSNGWQVFAPVPRAAQSESRTPRVSQSPTKRPAKIAAPRLARALTPRVMPSVVEAEAMPRESAAPDEAVLQILPVVEAESEGAPRPTATAPAAAPAPVAPVSVAPAPQPAPKPTVPVALSVVRHRPAITAASVELRPRRAEWNAPQPAMPDTRGVAWAKIADDRVAAPPAPEVAAENANDGAAAEALEHVTRLSDDRPDDVRNVVDEFRTSLLAANAENGNVEG